MKIIYGFRKGFSKQYSFIAMAEKWKWNPLEEGLRDALLLDISEAFDYVPPGFLLAKSESGKFTCDILNVGKLTFR